ncbi:MAG: hypothetical protein OXS35_06075 [Dehalococcoidia bacterium]|nr:hypothetical protein [Dehalococcoidia bacterium]
MFVPESEGRQIPGTVQSRMRDYLDTRLPPSRSSVDALHREVTVCHAYLCSFAYACNQKSARPAKVLSRRCMRYMPDHMRVAPSLSEMAIDLLARRRRSGRSISTETKLLLDRLRPDGPTR